MWNSLNNRKTLQLQKGVLIRKHFASGWKASWMAYQESHDRNPTAVQTAPLSKKERIGLHKNLATAESSSAVQIHTDKIGFVQFLQQQRVPTVTSPTCECSWNS